MIRHDGRRGEMNPEERKLERGSKHQRTVLQIVAITTPTFAVYYDPESDELWSIEVLCWALCEETRSRRHIDEEVSPERIVTGLVDYEGPILLLADEVCESDWGKFLYYSKTKLEDVASIDETMKEEVDRRRKRFAQDRTSVQQEK
jgi:hypothetical protein